MYGFDPHHVLSWGEFKEALNAIGYVHSELKPKTPNELLMMQAKQIQESIKAQRESKGL